LQTALEMEDVRIQKKIPTLQVPAATGGEFWRTDAGFLCTAHSMVKQRSG
jgi:hypothetical protein